MASAFPRGGDGSSTGVKRASAEAPSSSNDLFGSKRTKRIEVAPVKLSDKQKKLAKRAGGDKAKAGAGTGSLARAGLGQTNTSGGDHSVTKIEQLTFSKYQAGCLALGFVLNVTSSHAIISLPGGATGTVAYGEISDYCNRLCQAGRSNVGGKGQKEYGSDGKAKGSPLIRDLLPVNSPVKCYVLGVAEDKKSAKIKKTLELSCRLSLVNRGLALRHLLTGTTVAATVASVADDGYIMSAGIPDVTFYLPENKVPSSAGRLTLGATRDCVVDVVKEASRAVILRAQDKSVRDAVAFGTALTFNNLLPGNLVMVAVDRVIQVTTYAHMCMHANPFFVYRVIIHIRFKMRSTGGPRTDQCPGSPATSGWSSLQHTALSITRRGPAARQPRIDSTQTTRFPRDGCTISPIHIQHPRPQLKQHSTPPLLSPNINTLFTHRPHRTALL